MQDWFPLELTDLISLLCKELFKSLLQHHSLKASIPRLSAIFMVQISLLYMTAGKTTALAIQTHCGSSSFYGHLTSCWLQASWGESLWFRISSSPLPPLYRLQQVLSPCLVSDPKSYASAKVQLHSQTTFRWNGMGTSLHLPSEKTTGSREVTWWPLTPVVCPSSLAGSAFSHHPSTFLGSSWLKDLCPYFSHLSLPLTWMGSSH